MGLPIVVGYTAVGIPFGILATKAGVPVWGTALMCILVLAGSAQFIAVQLIAMGSGVLPIITATFVVNLRHFLMGSTLGGALPRLGIMPLIYLGHSITDETFGINIGKINGGDKIDPGSMFGTNIAAHVSWTLASVTGAWIGNLISIDIEYLSGVLPVMFVVLLALQLRRFYHYILTIIAIILTIIFVNIIPGQWPFLITAMIVPTAATIIDLWRERDVG